MNEKRLNVPRETERQKKIEKKVAGKIAAKLEATPPEYRAHVYKILVQEKNAKKAEKDRLEKQKLAAVLKTLKAQFELAEAPVEKKSLQTRIRKINKAIKGLRAKRPGSWSPVLSGSFEGGRG